jgi:hypothetical protein
MAKKDHVDIGEVIRSGKFAYGYYGSKEGHKGQHIAKKDVVFVDGTTKSRPVQFPKEDTPRNKPMEYSNVELGAYDESRGSALFVVESANLQGGGVDRFSRVADGWYVRARRLNDDRSYNPDGEVIEFYQSGEFSGIIPEVEVVGKMKMVFVW